MPFESKDFKQIAKRENILSNSDTVFHYTSLEGFAGIINSSGFWASDNRFMNDSEEIKHGIDLATSVLKNRIARATSIEFQSILEAAIEKINNKNRNRNLIACFSRSRDSLEQWRGYGPSGGVCIALNRKIQTGRPLFFGPGQLPFEVIYEWRRKAINLLSLLNRFEREFEIDAALMNPLPVGHIENYIREIVAHISYRILAFKNVSFRQEEEVRIIISEEYFPQYGGLKFRVSRFGLIPYVCTGDREGLNGRLPISEVIVGPSTHQDLIALSTRTFLDHNEYKDTPVLLSNIPFRG